MKDRPFILFLLLTIMTFSSCEFFRPSPQMVSVPMIYFTFNGNSQSSGIENFRTFGNQKMSFARGIMDSCLDLSINSYHRKPVIIESRGDVMLDHQSQYAVMVWVKMEADDFETYGIIGNKSIDEPTEKGWIISTTRTGSWKLEISDGNQQWFYQATPSRQKINDGQWHQLGFYIDKSENMAQAYFDGQQVGILNLPNLHRFEADYHIHIGCNPGSMDYSMDTFNGQIDEVGIWSKKLTPQDFKDAYLYIKKEKLPQTEYADETFSVLTWNIWNGGRQMGKTTGLQQVVKVIQQSGADIISLQEEFGSGEYIADQLNYSFYRCSRNLCVISRFPINNTYNIYRDLNAGGAQIMLEEDQSVIVCPIWLSFKPNIKGLLVNPEANRDTILSMEENSRASETRFIISELEKFNSQLPYSALILAGDFNSGSHLDWTPKNMSQKYNKTIPFPSSILMEKDGFVDAYRQIWPNEIEYPGNTYSPIFKEGYNDRIDYIFYKGNKIKAIDAKVINTAPTFFPSDHAAVLVTFKRN